MNGNVPNVKQNKAAGLMTYAALKITPGSIDLLDTQWKKTRPNKNFPIHWTWTHCTGRDWLFEKDETEEQILLMPNHKWKIISSANTPQQSRALVSPHEDLSQCLRKEGTEINLETLFWHLAATRPSNSVTVLGMSVLSTGQHKAKWQCSNCTSRAALSHGTDQNYSMML